MRSNLDDRIDAIKAIGEQEFYSNPAYEHLYDIDFPPCFLWVFNCFLELYSGCTTVATMASASREITWQDIRSYEQVRNIKFNQIEVDYIIKIKAWVNEIISELDADK